MNMSGSAHCIHLNLKEQSTHLVPEKVHTLATV